MGRELMVASRSLLNDSVLTALESGAQLPTRRAEARARNSANRLQLRCAL